MRGLPSLPTLAVALGALLACGDKEQAEEGTNAGDCTDRADNDGDGAFDCDDPGCAGSPDCADTGTSGGDGTGGTDGTDGTTGADGTDGADGADGSDGTDGTDGSDGTDGTDGTEPDGVDGVYVGRFTITATEGSTSEECIATWTGSSAAGCSLVTEGGCVEVIEGSVVDSRFECEFTGAFSEIGTTGATFGGSVSEDGVLTGTVDDYLTPVSGSVSGNTMTGSMTFSKDATTFTASFELER